MTEVMHCWDPTVTIGFAYHAPHIWTAGVVPRQCPGHVWINRIVYRLDRLPTEDQPGVNARPPESRPVCRYCDRVPDCAHVCDNCYDTARSEHLAACDDVEEYER